MKNAATNYGNGPPKRKPASGNKPLWEMTTAELRRATAEFDREFVGDSFGLPTAKQQRLPHKQKRGRPRVGAGSKTISVTVEEGSFAKADRLAKKLRVPRATLIARGLETLLAKKAVSQ